MFYGQIDDKQWTKDGNQFVVVCPGIIQKGYCIQYKDTNLASRYSITFLLTNDQVEELFYTSSKKNNDNENTPLVYALIGPLISDKA